MTRMKPCLRIANALAVAVISQSAGCGSDDSTSSLERDVGRLEAEVEQLRRDVDEIQGRTERDSVQAVQDSIAAHELECLAIADENWDPLDYLEWRGSTISRHSSITHSFPCSTFVEAATLGECPSSERQQYYEVIGKYDQFLSGWGDVSDSLGNTVRPSEIDSVANFHSDLRNDYAERCIAD